MGFWSSLAGKILDPLGVHRIFEKHAKSPKKVSGGFTMRSADSMHGLIVAAGQGNAAAKGQLDAIKAAAAKGDPAALKLMKYITPIARMVEGNLGSPSSLSQRLTMSRRQTPGRPAQNTQAALQRAQKTQAALQKAQNQIKALRQQQAQRAKQGAFHAQVQQRFKQEQDKYDAEIQAYDDKLVEAQKQLEKQGWDDNTRKQLEAQAQGYEAMIDKLTAAKEQVAEAAAVAAPAEAAPEAAAPVEAAPAEEAPVGEPGDVEIEE